jgi:hypothetical protein
VLEQVARRGFEIEFHSHAEAIFCVDFPAALRELAGSLAEIKIPIEELVRGGGGEADVTQRLRKSLTDKGWAKHEFQIRKLIDGEERESISHEIDHARKFEDGKKVALEIEWNNKDPFLDRDLENFKRLHAETAISVGIIVTRGRSLHENLRSFFLRFAQDRHILTFDDLKPYDLEPTRRQQDNVTKRLNQGVSFAEAWSGAFCADKFGESTTHWRKLEDRVRRGVGNPCPLLLIGIPASVVAM